MNRDFIEACNYVLPFGKFRGMRLSQVAASDRGYAYLDWLAGQMDPDNAVRRMILRVLAEPSRASRVEATIEY